ncbi:MAG: AraC family transcriptional regulator [Gammaproteobacteria bacterium]|nr:MAG: AraC family transcriptional regulator [Gammaproteobacteria bacterium]
MMELRCKPLLETHDAVTASRHLSGYLWPHSVAMQQPATRLAFRHRLASLGRISIHALAYGAPVTIAARPNDAYLFLVLTSGMGYVEQDGVNAAVRAIGACPLNPSGEAVMRFSPDEMNLTLRIPGELLRHWLRRETGTAVVEPLRFEPPTSGQQDVAGLRQYLEFLCAEVNRDSPALQQPALLRQFENTLLGLVLSSFPHNYSGVMQGDSGVPPYVAAAERFMRQNATRNLSLADVAAAAGVSERSLQAGFRQYRDCTPMSFLREQRLDAARQRLERAARSGESVTDIALGCGFNHLGKFAQLYRARFGETPSETRRRTAG